MIAAGVYCIRHVPSGQEYVGSSAGVLRRGRQHEALLASGKSTHPRLAARFTPFVKEEFSFRVLEECRKDELCDREQWWVDRLSPALNACPVARSSKAAEGQIATLVRECIAERGWSLYRLSKESGVGYRVIHNWLADGGVGVQGPYLDNLLRIMNALDLTFVAMGESA